MDLNTDRICENCQRDWRGDTECPTCGHINPLAPWEGRERGDDDGREYGDPRDARGGAMVVNSVRDVRRLGTCYYCNRIGKHGEGLIAIEVDYTASGRVKSRTLAHPRCYIQQYGTEKLIAFVPLKELDLIRLNDVSRKTMKALLHRLSLAGKEPAHIVKHKRREAKEDARGRVRERTVTVWCIVERGELRSEWARKRDAVAAIKRG